MRGHVLLLTLVLAWSPPRAAAAERMTLHWRAVSGCPDEETVRSRVERSTGSLDARDLRAVRAQVTRSNAEYQLELWLQAPSELHHKRFSAQSCSTFVELIVLELQLAAAAAAAPQETSAQDPLETSAQDPLAWGVRAGGGVGTGPTPRPAVGVVLAAGLARRRLLVELAGGYFTPRTVRYAQAPEVSARFDQFSLEGRGCYALPLGQLSLPLCAGAELGLLRGSASGVEQASRESRLTASVFAAPGLRIPLGGPAWVWLELGAWFGVLGPSFAVRNLPVLFRPDPVSVRGSAGVALKFD